MKTYTDEELAPLLNVASAWLEHCREAAEYHYGEGEDDTAEKWQSDADEAEKVLNRFS